MSFIDTTLSRKVSVGFTGGPEWSTEIVRMANGYDRRNSQWAMPHHRYTADFTLEDPDDKNELLAAFMACGGQADSFRFRDWNDFRVINQPMANGDGTTAPRQLTKVYTFGPKSFIRPIFLPVLSTVRATANGVPIAVTADPLTGMVTPTAPWPSGQLIRIWFDFDVRVRFGSDFIPFNRNAKRLALVTVELVEALTP